MAGWVPPDKYEGRLVLPGQLAPDHAPPAVVDEPSAFDRIAAAIERLYERSRDWSASC
jgi:phytoene/squalene synthetase